MEKVIPERVGRLLEGKRARMVAAAERLEGAVTIGNTAAIVQAEANLARAEHDWTAAFAEFLGVPAGVSS